LPLTVVEITIEDVLAMHSLIGTQSTNTLLLRRLETKSGNFYGRPSSFSRNPITESIYGLAPCLNMLALRW
jgi:hypothetical protein